MPTIPNGLRFAGMLLLASTACLCARAEVVLAPLFQNGCVLQRDQPLRIFGRADVGEKVTVAFGNQKVAACANAAGRWQVLLDPIPASGEGAVLTVQGRNMLTVRDVLVGDVWLCAGQSNMELPVKQAANPEQEIAGAQHPLIRHFKIERAVASAPAFRVEGRWVSCTPDTVGEFSAVAYFFALRLQQALDVPIGLVNASWGGTHIEAWLSDEALRSDPSHESVQARWRKRVLDYPSALEKYHADLIRWEHEEKQGNPVGRRRPVAPEGEGSRWMPTGLFNAMIAPLTPANLSGIIWYQGEANLGRHEEYRTLFPALIAQWRRDFDQAQLPFLFVQLANMEWTRDPSGEQWAWLRSAQAEALGLPSTGMAIAIDIGDPADIHPKNKQEVGRRLALLALNRVYDRKCVDEGPKIAAVTASAGQLRLRLDSSSGLVVKDAALTGFEIAGPTGEFFAARAQLDGDCVVLSSPQVMDPQSARYAWHNNPMPSLHNRDGLPLAPFWRSVTK